MQRGRRSRPQRPPWRRPTLDLSYTRVTSPISGLVGTTKVKPGNLVGRGESTLLTTISQIDPVLFKVGVTEADYLRVARQVQAAGKSSGGSREGIELTLADGTSVSAYRQNQHRRARRRSDDRHAGNRARLPQPAAAPAAGPIRSRAHPARHQDEARSSFRSAPCRNSRISTASLSSMAAGRSPFAT